MTRSLPSFPLPGRWLVILVVTVSSALNYLDRQLLPAFAPELREECSLNNAEYGLLLAAFSLTYAISAPFAGAFIDRAGLNRGLCTVVVFWSVAGMATGLAPAFLGLLLTRGALGVAQAGGVPGTGKSVATYLQPGERALGTATTQIGLSMGAVAAPLVAASVGAAYGWRPAFLLAGMLGILWIPAWVAITRRIPPAGAVEHPRPRTAFGLVRDRRLWLLVAATLFYMTLYSLWSNWTTVFLVEEHGLSLGEANGRLAWIPPLFANAGGLFGGWLSFRWVRGGMGVVKARVRVCWLSALCLLATLLVPYAPSAGLATVLVCLSFFWVTAMSVNVYALPLDVFGAASAAFATSVLTGAYGVMQTFVSPLIGALVDGYGFGPVCAGGAMLPLFSVLLLTRIKEAA